MSLTKRQKEVLNYLVSFLNKNGYAPSFEEIAHALKLTSLATVHKHLSTLEKKGFIRRGYNQSRSIEVVRTFPSRFESRCWTGTPSSYPWRVGSPPESPWKRWSRTRPFPGGFHARQTRSCCRCAAESMRDDHILDGDYIVVEQTHVANPGEIVVALVDEDEATVKRFYREPNGRVRLQPANEQMAPIIVPAANVKIQGKVVGVLRKY